jgi:hypothetical protein
VTEVGLPVDAPIDVHQHLWPPALVDALRARSAPPALRGWTLHLEGEPPYEVRAFDHDVHSRVELLDDDQLAVVSLSGPLGLEDLPAPEAEPLLDAWHSGAAQLPERFAAWAAIGWMEPDLEGLAERLDAFVGLQVPATWLGSPAALEKLAPVLEVCQRADRAVLVHPGPVTSSAGPGASAAALPGWWPAVVDYPAQMQAAWWAWHEAGRSLLPTLRIGFVAGAGLAPLHHERLVARGGRFAVDPGVFVETSSYGPQAVDALIRVLGIDPIVRGSDHPYAQPSAFGFGAAADRAIDVRNPRRFLYGGTP